MFISQSMTSKVITVDRDLPLWQAYELMNKNKIRHLPVVDTDNRLQGIVTDRDIRSALPSKFVKGVQDELEEQRFKALKVAEVMTTKTVTVSPTDTLPDALLLIQATKVGAFPVVDKENKLIGIISVRDLLRAFINVLGIGQPGTLLGIVVEEKVGQLKRIVDCITEENISFGSVLVARTWEKNKRAVFPYLLTNNVIRVKKKLKEMGFTLLDPMEYYLDQLPKKE